MKPQVEKPTESLAGCMYLETPYLGIVFVKQTNEKGGKRSEVSESFRREVIVYQRMTMRLTVDISQSQHQNQSP